MSAASSQLQESLSTPHSRHLWHQHPHPHPHRRRHRHQQQQHTADRLLLRLFLNMKKRQIASGLRRATPSPATSCCGALLAALTAAAVAQFLVEAGCSVGEQDTEGVSALALAELMAFQGVARVISAHQRLSSQQSVFSAEK